MRVRVSLSQADQNQHPDIGRHHEDRAGSNTSADFGGSVEHAPEDTGQKAELLEFRLSQVQQNRTCVNGKPRGVDTGSDGVQKTLPACQIFDTYGRGWTRDFGPCLVKENRSSLICDPDMVQAQLRGEGLVSTGTPQF